VAGVVGAIVALGSARTAPVANVVLCHLERLMNPDEFIDTCELRFDHGQRELSDAMRALVAREEPDVYAALADADPSSFLEPLLFTYFYAERPPIELPQIAFGHVPRALRPDAFPVRSDVHGGVYLPNLGHVHTEQIDTELTAVHHSGSGRLTLLLGPRPIPHWMSGKQLIGDTAIELLWQSNPLLDITFTDTDGKRLNATPNGAGSDHAAALVRAFAQIARLEPAYYGLITRAVRQVFVFRHPHVNCFATLNAHGIVFLNALERDDEIFFIDELVHQCGHVIFNAISLRRREFFRVDPDLTMAALAPERCPGEARSLYTVLHGLYTEHAMVRCLRALDEAQAFQGRRAHELRGRLAFIARKMEIDLCNMDQPGLCSPLGESFLEVFRRTFCEARRERADLVADDLRDQPYNFSYERYARRNPPPRPLSEDER
jgi:hypothetical protein